jgi:hypothetical protein
MAGSKAVQQAAPLGFFGLLAYIGAAVYFIGQSDGGFWGVILGLLQAIVWPAYAVYGGLTALAV